MAGFNAPRDSRPDSNRAEPCRGCRRSGSHGPHSSRGDGVRSALGAVLGPTRRPGQRRGCSAPSSGEVGAKRIVVKNGQRRPIWVDCPGILVHRSLAQLGRPHSSLPLALIASAMSCKELTHRPNSWPYDEAIMFAAATRRRGAGGFCWEAAARSRRLGRQRAASPEGIRVRRPARCGFPGRGRQAHRGRRIPG